MVIIFVDDGGDPSAALRSALAFNPGCMRSHFNHVFVLVTYDRKAESFRVVVQSAESVPTFAPALPPSGEFTDHVAFRDFLLAKRETHTHTHTVTNAQECFTSEDFPMMYAILSCSDQRREGSLLHSDLC